MRTETWQNKVNTCIKYHIIHPFFHDTCISYGTTFPLKLTSVSDVSSSMYSAVKFTFYFSAKSICKVMGMRCIRNKRLGAALTWFLRSKVSYKLFDITNVDTLCLCWSVFDFVFFFWLCRMWDLLQFLLKSMNTKIIKIRIQHLI